MADDRLQQWIRRFRARQYNYGFSHDVPGTAGPPIPGEKVPHDVILRYRLPLFLSIGVALLLVEGAWFLSVVIDRVSSGEILTVAMADGALSLWPDLRNMLIVAGCLCVLFALLYLVRKTTERAEPHRTRSNAERFLMGRRHLLRKKEF